MLIITTVLIDTAAVAATAATAAAVVGCMLCPRGDRRVGVILVQERIYARVFCVLCLPHRSPLPTPHLCPCLCLCLDAALPLAHLLQHARGVVNVRETLLVLA